MPCPHGGTTDLEWALGVPLDRFNTVGGGARLALRFAREEVERLQAENRRARARIEELEDELRRERNVEPPKAPAWLAANPKESP